MIDVSGDGPNNTGLSITAARDRAIAAGATVNGLAMTREPESPAVRAELQFYKFPSPPFNGFRLDDYYRQNVIGGPGAFVLEARGAGSFGEALRRKLIMEIAGREPVGAVQLKDS